jgi:serine/threonine-protein kinase HipA
MNRSAKIFMHNVYAGMLSETESGYAFGYDEDYLKSEDAFAVSKTLPLQPAEYKNNVLFPFFDGLIPEGWLLDIAEENWKINNRDRFGLLLVCCKNCIGAVSVRANEKL